MIKVEHLSFGFPNVELYSDVSFTLEYGQHCAFIGSNGTGKTTLIEIMLNPDKFMYDGKIIRDEDWRVGYVNQFDKSDKERRLTVFEYLSEDFVKNQAMQDEICTQMQMRRILSLCWNAISSCWTSLPQWTGTTTKAISAVS